MKKLIIGSIFLGILFFMNYNAAAQSFQEGDAVINGGLGLGTTYSWGAGLGIPLGAGLEYGVSDLDVGSIGVGGDFGFISGSGVTIMYIGGKGSYHFNDLFEIENDDLDVYGGLGIYYRTFNWDSDIIGASSDDVVAGFHIGTRYYFADNIGGYAELGNNWAWLNVGIHVKL